MERFFNQDPNSVLIGKGIVDLVHLSLHRVRRGRSGQISAQSFEQVFHKLLVEGLSPDDLFSTVCNQVSCYL